MKKIREYSYSSCDRIFYFYTICMSNSQAFFLHFTCVVVVPLRLFLLVLSSGKARNMNGWDESVFSVRIRGIYVWCTVLFMPLIRLMFYATKCHIPIKYIRLYAEPKGEKKTKKYLILVRTKSTKRKEESATATAKQMSEWVSIRMYRISRRSRRRKNTIWHTVVVFIIL